MVLYKSIVVYSVSVITLFCSNAVGSQETGIETISVVPVNAEACSLQPQEPELQTLLDLHNQSRRSGARCVAGNNNPVSIFQWNCRLANAAKKHAQNMYQEGFLSHKGSDNSSVGDRVTHAGYQWRNVGENVAEGFQGTEQVYLGWLNSRAHCKNIMNRNFEEFGAAKAGSHWVVVFGRQK